MNTVESKNILTIAIPTGRIQTQVFEYFHEHNINVEDPKRSLVVKDKSGNIRVILVKNSDLPEYINAGIASIGIVGTDIIYESIHSFFTLGHFPFAETNICLISKPETPQIDSVSHTTVASKYVKFTKEFLRMRDINAHIIKLNGSVEIAPLLGLAPYIVDLVETGRTIQDNGLVIAEELGKTRVALIANQSLYKLNYKAIDKIVRILKL